MKHLLMAFLILSPMAYAQNWTLVNKTHNFDMPTKAKRLHYFHSLMSNGAFRSNYKELRGLDVTNVTRLKSSKVFLQEMAYILPFSSGLIPLSLQYDIKYLKKAMRPSKVRKGSASNSFRISTPGRFGISYTLTSFASLFQSERMEGDLAEKEQTGFLYFKKYLAKRFEGVDGIFLDKATILYRRINRFSNYTRSALSWSALIPTADGQSLALTLNISAVKSRYAFKRILFPQAKKDSLRESKQNANTLAEYIDLESYALTDSPKGIFLSLHGLNANPWQHEFFFRVKKSALQRDLWFFSPRGPRSKAFYRYFKAGKECCDFFNEVEQQSHVEWIDELITKELEQIGDKSLPVYIFGHSNGSLMAHTLACKSKHKVKGILTLSGGMLRSQAPGLLKKCKNTPDRVIHIHGSDDKIIPPKGHPMSPLPKFKQTVSRWSKALAWPWKKVKKDFIMGDWSGEVTEVTGRRAKTYFFFKASDKGHFSRWNEETRESFLDLLLAK